MKKRLTSYTFDASAQTVVHADFSDVGLAGIQLIVNVTDQIIIYNFADASKGGTLATDTLTLEYDTTSMSDTDELMILVEDGVAAQTVSGTVTANLAAGTNNIGDVDVLSSALPTGASTLAEQQTQTTALQLLDDAVYADDADWTDNTSKHLLVGGVYQSTPHTVTDGDVSPALMDANGRLIVAATDNGGTLSVDDGGGAITVDGTVGVSGTVTVDGSGVTQPVSNAGLTALNGAITGTEVQVDVVGSLPAGTNNIGDVDIASIAAGDNNIGNVDIASIAAGDNNIGNVDLASAIPAGTNNIGDVDVLSVVPGTSATSLGKAEDAAHSSGDTGVFALGVRNDTPNTALAGTDLDYSAVSTYKTGAVRTAIPEEDFAALGSNHVKKYYTNSGAVTDGIVWSPAAGKRWYVTDIFINVSAAATVTLEDDLAAGDAVVWKAELAANSGWSHHFGTPLFSGEDAADLLVTTSAGNVYITITGYEI